MTKKENEDFENLAKYWICDNDYVDNDVEVRVNCHITGKFRDSAHRNRNVNIKLNHNIRFILHNLKRYDSTNLIMQEIGTFNLKINVIPNGLEKKYQPYHQ